MPIGGAKGGGGGSGNVFTSDVSLVAGQLLLGDGGFNIVTEPDLSFNGVTLSIIAAMEVESILVHPTGPTLTLAEDLVDLGEGGVFSIEGTAVINWNDGDIALENIEVLDTITEATILAISGNVTTVDTLTANRLLTGNGGSAILTEPDLFWDGSNFGIGTPAPVSTMHIYEDTVNNDATAGLTIEQDGTGDALLHFNLTGEQAWVAGQDNDAINMFKIQPGSVLDVNATFTIDTNGQVGINAAPPDRCFHVQAVIPDTQPLLKFETTGTNGAPFEIFFGTRAPEGLVTANPGDHYNRGSGVDSGLFIFAGASAGSTGWTETVTTSDVLAAQQLVVGNGTTDIVTEPDLVWDGAMFGIGIANPVSRAHFYEDTTFTGPSAGITIEQDGVGDAMLQFFLTGGMRWIMGIDNDDNDTFKINDAVNFSVDGAITIQPTTEYVGFGTNAAETRIDVSNSGGDAIRTRSGNASNFTLNQMKMSLDGGLLYTHAIKTRHHATNQFDNAVDFFLWDADTDAAGDVGTLPVLCLKGDASVGIGTFSPAAALDVFTMFADSFPVLKLESSTNAGEMRFRVGNQVPDGAVNGVGPDIYFRDDGVLSAMYENRNPSSANTWLRHSVYPSNIIELNSSAEFDELASGGIVTISAATTLVFKMPITTANRIEITGAGTPLHMTANDGATSSITYTGTGTFFTSAGGSLQIHSLMQVISASTGTLLDIDGGPGVNFDGASIIGWDDLGTVANTGFLTSKTRYLNVGSGLTLTNTFIVNASLVLLIGSPLNAPLFTINLNNPDSALSFVDIQGIALGATGSLFDLDTRINNGASIKISQCSARAGNLFKPSVLTDATIDSVADGSPATGTITAMADNGSGGTTISSTTTYFEDEEVTISGTTSYDGDFQIFNVVAGVSFDTITAFVADDATGSVDSVRLTLSLATGHGISIGDSIKIIDTNFYNGFQTTLNVVSDDITVNGTFISTNTGSIERELSLDQSDPRVTADNNNGFVDSHAIATAHVNDNSTANGTIVNNTFTDMVFGTVGSALLANSTMERWRLVDEINGTFEYFGQEPFDGRINFDFTVLSSGGTVDFRFKWVIDAGAGFVDLADNVEALVAVGSSSQSISKTYPLAAFQGHRIKPQITRNSGTSTITATYVTMYVSQ